mmetsp:Transcript_8512/g.14697  ORF Transcript_8512/g.14697 Transcript_8512/m.14697 type:complete len:119 (+) Transcript_8512:22-378(+)
MGLFRLSIIPLTAIYGVAINGIGTALCYQDFKKPGSIPHTNELLTVTCLFGGFLGVGYGRFLYRKKNSKIKLPTGFWMATGISVVSLRAITKSNRIQTILKDVKKGIDKDVEGYNRKK